MSDGALRSLLVDFVRSTGIEVRAAALADGCFLPGLDIGRGMIRYDAARWLYAGDLLHEAGHLAVTAPEERGAPKLDPTPGDEMASIAWSYAAARHLGIDPAVVFHPHGYKGGAQALLDAFSGGGFVGMPLLHAYGMTVDPRWATPSGPPPYPHMLRWLR